MKRPAALLLLSMFLATPAFAANDEKPSARSQESKSGQAGDEPDSPSKTTLSPDNRSVKGLEARVEYGRLAVDLKDRFQHALVLKISPDGTRTIKCVDSVHDVEKLLEPDQTESSTAIEDPEED